VPEIGLEEAQEDVQGTNHPPVSEAELRVLHEGMLLLNWCIQEPGAGEGPTSVVFRFLGTTMDLRREVFAYFICFSGQTTPTTK